MQVQVQVQGGRRGCDACRDGCHDGRAPLAMPCLPAALPACSVQGLSCTSFTSELFCYMVSVAYNLANGYAFSTFGDTGAARGGHAVSAQRQGGGGGMQFLHSGRGGYAASAQRQGGMRFLDSGRGGHAASAQRQGGHAFFGQQQGGGHAVSAQRQLRRGPARGLSTQGACLLLAHGSFVRWDWCPTHVANRLLLPDRRSQPPPPPPPPRALQPSARCRTP